MFKLNPFMDTHDEDGCRKAFFIEGWINNLACEMNDRLYQQEKQISQLENRIKQLEELLKNKTVSFKF